MRGVGRTHDRRRRGPCRRPNRVDTDLLEKAQKPHAAGSSRANRGGFAIFASALAGRWVARQQTGSFQQLVALAQDPLRVVHVPAAAAGVVHAERVAGVPPALLERPAEQLSRVVDDLALARPRLFATAPAVPLVLHEPD